MLMWTSTVSAEDSPAQGRSVDKVWHAEDLLRRLDPRRGRGTRSCAMGALCSSGLTIRDEPPGADEAPALPPAIRA
jgi:hypothetical protein